MGEIRCVHTHTLKSPSVFPPEFTVRIFEKGPSV
jgi:hypothetical protein